MSGPAIETAALGVACPECGSRIGVHCRKPMTPQGKFPLLWAPHQQRVSRCRPVDLVAEYCYRLWGQAEGFACLGHGVPYAREPGKYGHENFREEYVLWPRDRLDLYHLALKLRDREDVYIAPVLRAEGKRTKETAKPSRFLYGEVDDPWTGEHQATFDDLAEAGSFTVRSGGYGRHLYLALDQFVEWQELERLNRRVTVAFSGDSKWDATVFLRPPGSFHHKRRVWFGEEPVLVQFDTRVEVAA